MSDLMHDLEYESRIELLTEERDRAQEALVRLEQRYNLLWEEVATMEAAMREQLQKMMRALGSS